MLKSANGFLNMVAVGDTVASVNCPMHATHLICTLRDHYVLGVLFEAVTVPLQGEQVGANDVCIGESAMKQKQAYPFQKEGQRRGNERERGSLLREFRGTVIKPLGEFRLICRSCSSMAMIPGGQSWNSCPRYPQTWA